APRQFRNVHVFVCGVRAVTDRSQPVDRGHAKRTGEVAVGTAPGGSFLEVAPEQRRHAARDREEVRHGRRSLQWRPLEPASNVETCPATDWLQALKLRFHSPGVGHRRGTYIDDGPCVFGDDVRPAASLDDSYVDADAAIEVLEPLDPGDLRGELVDRARAFAGIDA